VTGNVLHAERRHLAGLLEAVQRCVYFLDASDKRIPWPLTAAHLEQNKKNVDLFESLAAINERFAKLQDTLGAAMRHSLVLSGEPGETFLKVLAFYDKAGVIDSVSVWQLCRATRKRPPPSPQPSPLKGEGEGVTTAARSVPAPAIGPRVGLPHMGAAPSPRLGRGTITAIGPRAGLPHVGAAPSPRFGRWNHHSIGPRAGLPHMGAPARGRPWLYRRRSGNNHAPALPPRSSAPHQRPQPVVGAAPSPRFGRGNRHDGNNHAPARSPRSTPTRDFPKVKVHP
jgi:hypothetical protein